MNIILLWPIALVVVSNVFYHICAKSMPERIDPFAALTVTYLVGALVSLICDYILGNGDNILHEYRQFNWTPFVLGMAIVGLEVGNIFMYKVGWNLNTGYLVSSAILAVALLFIGFLIYGEVITWTKVIGILICMVGIYFITK